MRGNWLYVAGSFGYINGTAHSLFARVNATTGAIDSTFQINASVPRPGGSVIGWTLAVSPDGNTIVGGGNFTQVNGAGPQPDLRRGEPVNGAPGGRRLEHPAVRAALLQRAFPYYVQDIDFSDDGSYFAVGANGGRDANAYCDAVSRWETSARGSNLDATWVDFTGTDSVTSVEAADNVVYTGGHFRWMNNPTATTRPARARSTGTAIAALDPSNGMPFNWNPTRSAGGATLPPGGTPGARRSPRSGRAPTASTPATTPTASATSTTAGMALFPTPAAARSPAANAYDRTPRGYLYVGGTGGSAGEGDVQRHDGDGAVHDADPAEPRRHPARCSTTVANRFYWSKTDASAPERPDGALVS